MKGWWHDDGEGLSYTLWSSQYEYNNYTADMNGYVDNLLNPKTHMRCWRAFVAVRNEYPCLGWYSTAEKAMQAVTDYLYQQQR